MPDSAPAARPEQAPGPPAHPAPPPAAAGGRAAARGAAGGWLLGIAPHLLHHAGILVGSAFLAGAVGSVALLVVALACMAPLWCAPGDAGPACARRSR